GTERHRIDTGLILISWHAESPACGHVPARERCVRRPADAPRSPTTDRCMNTGWGRGSPAGPVRLLDDSGAVLVEPERAVIVPGRPAPLALEVEARAVGAAGVTARPGSSPPRSGRARRPTPGLLQEVASPQSLSSKQPRARPR